MSNIPWQRFLKAVHEWVILTHFCETWNKKKPTEELFAELNKIMRRFVLRPFYLRGDQRIQYVHRRYL